MSQYAAQVEAAVARLKSSCAEGPFKALLRDLSEIIRKLTDPNSRRTAQRIELTKLIRENDSTDDLKTLLSTLGFDDDQQRPGCMIITEVDTNVSVLCAFLTEAARELNCVEGVTYSSSDRWPQECELRDVEFLADEHPQMKVISRYFADCHYTVSPDDGLKTAAVFSYYFCGALVSLPMFTRFLHDVGPVDVLCRWLLTAKRHIDNSASLLELLGSSSVSRSCYETTMKKVENFVTYTAFSPSFKEDYQTIQEDVNCLLDQLKVEMQKPSRNQLLLIFRFALNLSRLVAQVTPLALFMPLHAPDISDENIKFFCSSAKAVIPFVKPEYAARLKETCKFLSKHSSKLAYDELSSLLINLAEQLVCSISTSFTSAVPQVSASPQLQTCTSPDNAEISGQPASDGERMVCLLGTAADVPCDVAHDALQLGLSQEEYERALQRQLAADMEWARQQSSPHGVVTPPLVLQQGTLSKQEESKDHKRSDTKGKAGSRDEFTEMRLPGPLEEEDSGLAMCTDEQSGQQVAEGADVLETLADQQHTSSCRGEKLLGDVHHEKAPTLTADPVKVTWHKASGQRQSDNMKTTTQSSTPEKETGPQEEDESTPLVSLSTSSSAVEHFNEIVQAAPAAFSLALSTAQGQLQEEMKKKEELEKGYESLATGACGVVLLEGIRASEKNIAVLQERVAYWTRLSTIASSLTQQKEGTRKRVP